MNTSVDLFEGAGAEVYRCLSLGCVGDDLGEFLQSVSMARAACMLFGITDQLLKDARIERHLLISAVP